MARCGPHFARGTRLARYVAAASGFPPSVLTDQRTACAAPEERWGQPEALEFLKGLEKDVSR